LTTQAYCILTPCSASADGTAYNSGGKISVGGLQITIPKNLQVQFPAAWVPFKDFASGGYLGNELSVCLFGPFLIVQWLIKLTDLWQLR
jgi:hypothetical protein